MLNPLPVDDTSSAVLSVATATVRQKAGLFSLAGDALCLAMTAFRLTDTAAAATTTAAPTAPSAATAHSPTVITLDEVSWHDHYSDCWVVVYDGVYNITHFLHEHPGGSEILFEYAGRDATVSFRDIGHGRAMIRALEPYLVGVLPEAERLFRSPWGGAVGANKDSRGLM